MKKILLAGIVVLLVMFFVTCAEFFPEEKEVEYTDVEYSADGSRVTVYLDGIGVPKTQAQRAMTTDLARIAYDYLEVIFVSGAKIARASWDLGQAAGISGVDRSGTGKDYLYGASKTDNVALMFVGRSDTKLLLGIGQLAEVDHSRTDGVDAAVWTLAKTANAAGYPGPTFATGPTTVGTMPTTPFAFIRSESKSVTFYITAVKTGLFVDGETAGLIDSFDFVAAGSTGSAGTWGSRATHSQRIPLGTTSPIVSYPLYTLPQKKDTTAGPYSADGNVLQNAKYTFLGAAADYKAQIMLRSAVKVERRLPRYLDGGLYYSPKGAAFDIKSLVTVDAAYTGAVDAAFVNVIPLVFEVKSTGLFSFFVDVPVYMLSKAAATNGGPAAETWKIRSGFGSELYSLDDGIDGAGGCVLMGVGNTGADWLNIEWEWLQ